MQVEAGSRETEAGLDVLPQAREAAQSKTCTGLARSLNPFPLGMGQGWPRHLVLFIQSERRGCEDGGRTRAGLRCPSPLPTRPLAPTLPHRCPFQAFAGLALWLFLLLE